MRWAVRIGALALILFGFYSAYWFYAANRINKILHNELLHSHNLGTGIALETTKVSGYPFKFQLNTGNISVENYRKPHMKIRASSIDSYSRPWAPTKLYLKHSGTSQLDIPAAFEQWAFEMNVGSAEAMFDQKLTGGWNAYEVEIQNLTISQPGSDMKPSLPEQSRVPPLSKAESVKIKYTRKTALPLAEIQAQNLYFSGESFGQISLALGDHIARLDGTLTGMAINGQTASIELWRPGVTLKSDDMNIVWGSADFSAGLDLRNTSEGVSGTIALSLANHTGLLSHLFDVGILSSQERFAVNLIMASAKETEDGRRQITLKVNDDDVYLGPIMIGKLPY